MTTSPSRPWLRFALAICIAGGSLVFSSTDAEARGIGKKAGWSKRSSSAAKVSVTTEKAKSPRKGLFARIAGNKKSSERVRVAVVAQPRPRSNRSAAVSIPTLRPQPRPQSPSLSVAARLRAEATPPKPAKKRTGLLARLFTIEDRPPVPAARTQPVASTKPQLAPGQPNANQSAPKINHSLIANSSKSQSSVTINIARQRAYCYIDGQVAVDTPISTARGGKYTPRGSFRVGERVHTGKISTIYDVEMPRWMRLGQSAYGMHAGYLPGYPASAGCIRMPHSAADAIYKATGYGTRVKIIGG